MMGNEERQRAVSRLIRFLRHGPADCVAAATADRTLVEAGDRGAVSIASDILDAMQRDGLVVREAGRIALSREGSVASRRLEAVCELIADRHQDIGLSPTTGLRAEDVAFNLAESPLAQLARRRAKNGTPYLSASEVSAGERLRADYTRGQIMPRLGANWEASVASGRRGDAGGAADLAEAALAARQRVEKALAAVGPELSGVLVDICCFLKGLERVEFERGWPARSSKVVLKSALGVLSRHYEPSAARHGRTTLHWGTPDYRPSIR